MKQYGYDLTKGRVSSVLLAFTLPFLAANFMQVLYGAVDLYVVGRFCAAASVTAVTTGSKVTKILTVIISGLTVGATVAIGDCIGKKDYDGAGKTAGNASVMALVLAAVLTPALFLLAPRIVTLLKMPPEATEEAIRYVSVCFLGIPFIISYNLLSGIMRGMGDSKGPMLFILEACVINICLDFLLVGVFRLGVAGAAVATVSAQCAGTLFGVLYVLRRNLPFKLTAESLAVEGRAASRILAIGVPIAAQDGFLQISFITITAIANARGLVDSAAVGIVETLISCFFLVPTAFGASITTMTAQNNGAGKKERSIRAMRLGVIITTVFGGCIFLTCNLIPQTLVGAFVADSAVIAAGAAYIRTYSFDCMAAGFPFCTSGYLCGCGRAGIVFVQNVLSTILVRIPLAYLLSHAFTDTLMPMGLASPLGQLTSAAFYVVFFIAAGKIKHTKSA